MEMDDVEPVRVADHRPPESYYLLLPILRRRLEEHLHRGPDTDNEPNDFGLLVNSLYIQSIVDKGGIGQIQPWR
jgi:hypothetical protein